jgi:hypothetical protein
VQAALSERVLRPHRDHSTPHSSGEAGHGLCPDPASAL